MKLGYFDEAFTEGEDDWFIFGGLVIDEASWGGVSRIEEALSEEASREFESLTKIANPDPGFDRDLKEEASNQIYHTLNVLGYTPIIVIVDQTSALGWSKVNEPADIYNIAFSNLVERFQMHLQNRGSAPDDCGVMFIDERDDKSFKDLRDYHYELRESGTQFIKPTDVVGVAAPLRDDKANAMALADWMVSAAGTHLVRGNSTYYKHLYDNFDRHPDTGDLVGTGVKVVPNKSISKLEKHPDDI